MAPKKNLPPRKANPSANSAKARAKAKKVATPKTTRSTPNGRARTLAAENPDTPALQLLEPGPNHFAKGWQGNLQWLMSLPGFSVDVIADRASRHRAAVYKWLDPTEYGNDISFSTLEALAEALGFPPIAWHYEISEFAAMIFTMYPGYIGGVLTDNGSGGNNPAELFESSLRIIHADMAEGDLEQADLYMAA